MKASVFKSDILSAIQKIQSIIPQKPQVPVLSHLSIRACKDEQTIILCGSDLNISMKAEIPAKVEEEGHVLLPTKKLFPLLRELIAPELTLKSTPSFVVTLHSGSSQFKIPGMSPEGFPTMPEPTESQQLSFATALLKELLFKTTFSASKDEKRPIFNSILLQRQNAVTTFTGTDGKRLAKVHSDAPVIKDWQGSFVLPLKAADEIFRLLDTKEEQIEIALSQGKIFMQVGNITLISQLIGASYPDVSRIIPDNLDINVVLHREELISLLRQIALFTTTESPSARFTFAPGELQLSVAGSLLGEGVVSMPIDYVGDIFQIAFNPDFFLEILHHSKEETVSIRLKDAYTPGIITDSSSSLFVLMPMRLDP